MRLHIIDGLTISEAKHRRLRRLVIDATVEALNEHANMMACGEIPMLSGPDALRDFAASINLALVLKEQPRPGLGWQNVCRACFGALIDWPGMRRCNCVTTMAAEHPTTT